MLVLAMVVAACGDQAPSPTADESTPATGEPSESTPAESEPPSAGGGRLGTVQSRGELICGVNGGLPGFSFLEEDGTNSGFDADFCRAVAAAVLGDPEAVEFRALSTDQRGPALQTGEVDVLIRNTTWTVSRDTTWSHRRRSTTDRRSW
jgi:general L-amino acid transport system substrate-binding protein